MMFGPPDSESVHSDRSMRWKIKRFSNDDLRQRFVDATVPQAEHLGLSIPDEALAPNEDTGHYQTGPIDWNEFKEVLNGNGPCNDDRLAEFTKARNDGQWVRDAARAWARKNDGRAA